MQDLIRPVMTIDDQIRELTRLLERLRLNDRQLEAYAAALAALREKAER
jgi:ABC-type dipeptide/oligopeptide/nickel transport system ATPase component